MKTHISILATAATVVLLAFSTLILISEEGLEKISSARLPTARIALKSDEKGDSAAYLRSMDVQIEVTGNIASTRYTMVFQNRTNRDLEGTLTFPLPAGRGVTYFAVDIDGKMREGMPVGKTDGTWVSEAIRLRLVKPGLLERTEGNIFRARVYPIPARRTRAISIGYEEELTLESGAMTASPPTGNTFLRYNLPVICTDSLEKFSVKATVVKGGKKTYAPESEDWFNFHLEGDDYVASFTEEDYRPARALTFALPTVGEAPYVTVQPAPADIPRMMTQPPPGSYYFVATVAPNLEARPKRNETPRFLGVERGKAVREVYPSIATPFYESFSVAGISGSDSAELTLLFGFGNTVEKRVKVRLDAKGAAESGNAHKIWAQKKIAELDLDYENNRADIMELGQRFGVVTRDVSFIVLETFDAYCHYGIMPPPDIRSDYSRVVRLWKLKIDPYRYDAFDYFMAITDFGLMSDVELEAEDQRYWEFRKQYYGEEAFDRYHEPTLGIEYLRARLNGRRKSDAEFQAEFQRVRALEDDMRMGIINGPEFMRRLYNPDESGSKRDTRLERIKRRWYSMLSPLRPVEVELWYWERMSEEMPARCGGI